MTQTSKYTSPQALNRAISDAAKRAAKNNPALDANTLVRLAHFDRFLSRVFIDHDTDWILKGGTALLARIPESRSTRDIDLMTYQKNLAHAENDLITRAATDLGDFFRFPHKKTIRSSDDQRNIESWKVTFTVFLGATSHGNISIDLVTGPVPTGTVETMDPISRLPLRGLTATPYRLYPIEDHIADKVCAITDTYASGESSREKDMADLVVTASIAHQTIDAAELYRAIDTERRRRGLDGINHLAVPPELGARLSPSDIPDPSWEPVPDYPDSFGSDASVPHTHFRRHRHWYVGCIHQDVGSLTSPPCRTSRRPQGLNRATYSAQTRSHPGRPEAGTIFL